MEIYMLGLEITICFISFLLFFAQFDSGLLMTKFLVVILFIKCPRFQLNEMFGYLSWIHLNILTSFVQESLKQHFWQALNFLKDLWQTIMVS
jgi:hypothetical protein